MYIYMCIYKYIYIYIYKYTYIQIYIYIHYTFLMSFGPRISKDHKFQVMCCVFLRVFCSFWVHPIPVQRWSWHLEMSDLSSWWFSSSENFHFSVWEVTPWSLTWNLRNGPPEKEIPFWKPSFSASMLKTLGVYIPEKNESHWKMLEDDFFPGTRWPILGALVGQF